MKANASVSLVLYGLPRRQQVTATLFSELRQIINDAFGDEYIVSCFKYDQRQDCVAHGGVLYTHGGRKK